MFKKIGVRLGIVAMLLGSFGTSWDIAGRLGITAYAYTAAQLDERIQNSKDELAALEQEEAAARSELDGVENDLHRTLARISEVEESIQQLEEELDDLRVSMEIIEIRVRELDEEIGVIQAQLARRFELTQRLNNTNTILGLLEHSTSIIDFVRNFRFIADQASVDAELIHNLTLLVEEQQDLLHQLIEQRETSELKQEALERENSRLIILKDDLEAQREVMVERIRDIESEQLTAQEALNLAQQHRNSLNQFGVVNNVVSGGGYFIIPLLSGIVTCEWMCYPQHTGIDLSSSNSTQAVLAAASGTVTIAGWHNAYGNYVVISHLINGQEFTTLYAHLSAIHVSVGQQVEQGEHIGNMGSTGNSTGPHLHFEIYVGPLNWPHARNPRDFLHFPSSW